MARRYVSYEERDEFFDLLCSGLSLQSAAALSGVSAAAGRGWWQASGLVNLVIQMGTTGRLPGSPPPRVPGQDRAERTQAQRRALSSEDRAVIAAGRKRDLSYAQIGELIDRDKSVVCREVARNRGTDGSYWAPVAHRAAHERRRRPKEFKLHANPRLCRRIETWMDDGWSPGLIAQVLRCDAATNMMERVSAETIYQALYVQTRGGLRKDLAHNLALKRRQR